MKNYTKPIFKFLIVTLVVLLISSVPDLNAQTASGVAQAPPPIDKKTQQEIIDSVCIALNEIYVFPQVALDMEKLVRENLKRGEYKEITDLQKFSMRLTEDLRSISHDLHLGLRPVPPGYTEEEDPDWEENYIKMAEYENFGFRKIEFLPGNIGYLKFNQFYDSKYGGKTAIAAMKMLSNCDALIIDLRENGGGSPSMIQLITSYFFEESVHLNSFYVRATDSIEQYWTSAFVDGKRLLDQPIYVLTSSYTFSGAEEFSYNLRNLKRATLIGDTTGGGAHPVDTRLFTNLGIGLRLPFGRAINPITGTNWEGVGVAPHIPVPSETALDVALAEAYQYLIDSSNNDQTKFQLQWALDGQKVKLNPVTLAEEKLSEYVASYGPRQVMLENGKLIYQRKDRPKFVLLPMGNDLFFLPDLDYFRMKFERNDKGEIIRLHGLYDQGRTDSNDRDS